MCGCGDNNNNMTIIHTDVAAEQRQQTADSSRQQQSRDTKTTTRRASSSNIPKIQRWYQSVIYTFLLLIKPLFHWLRPSIKRNRSRRDAKYHSHSWPSFRSYWAELHWSRVWWTLLRVRGRGRRCGETSYRGKSFLKSLVFTFNVCLT